MSRKAVQDWVEKFSQGRPKVTDDAQQGVKMTATTVKRFVRCGFDALVKLWDKFINTGGGYVEK
jgi:hypothetical protein